MQLDRADHGGTLTASPYDPQTRYTSKGSTDWVGYKVHFSETCEADLPEVVTNVRVTSASENDIVALPSIHENLNGKHLLPGQHFVDGAYVSADLSAASRTPYDIDLIGPAKRGSRWQQCTLSAFTHQDFHIDWERKDVKCPQGYLNQHWVETTNADGLPIVHVEFRRHSRGAAEGIASPSHLRTDAWWREYFGRSARSRQRAYFAGVPA